jgi:hypothetical protein
VFEVDAQAYTARYMAVLTSSTRRWKRSSVVTVLPRCGSNSYVGFNDDDRFVTLENFREHRIQASSHFRGHVI